jgi:pseudoazurin
MMSAKVILLSVVLTAAVPIDTASARTIVVQMRNAGPEGAMVFSPAMVEAELGDIVRFVPTDPTHNAEAIPDLWPAGVPPLKGAINQPVAFRVDKPGLYGIRCLPHYAMGMVGLIRVGKAALPADVATVARLPAFAAKRMNGYLAAAR